MGGEGEGGAPAFDHTPWTVRAGRSLRHLVQLPHFIDKKNQASRHKETAGAEPARRWLSQPSKGRFPMRTFSAVLQAGSQN